MSPCPKILIISLTFDEKAEVERAIQPQLKIHNMGEARCVGKDDTNLPSWCKIYPFQTNPLALGFCMLSGHGTESSAHAFSSISGRYCRTWREL